MLEFISNLVDISLYTILPFLLLIGILVFIHEFGHYYVARLFKIPINEFAVGMGKELFSKIDKKGCKWSFRLLPIGGYVKFEGDEDISSSSRSYKKKKDINFKNIESTVQSYQLSDNPSYFHNRPKYQKILVTFAGPAINILFGALIFSILSFSLGKVVSEPVVTSFSENSAAKEAGLQINDRIIKVNNIEMNSLQDISYYLTVNLPEKVKLDVLRNDIDLTFNVLPNKISKDTLFGKNETVLLGIMSNKTKRVEMSLFESIVDGSSKALNSIPQTFQSLYQIITGKRSIESLSGPVKIAEVTGKVVKASDNSLFSWNFLILMASISIGLGVMNLLPIPVLDGGHILRYTLEYIFGRELSPNVEEYIMKVGVVVLLSLFVLIAVKDIYFLFV